jgi:unsaturated rhamnogalacturonyl hydrolase
MARPTETWNNNWGETLQLYGLLSAGYAFGRSGYVAYVSEWLENRLSAGLRVSAPSDPIDADAYRSGPMMYITGYCGSWGANLIVPAQRSPSAAATELERRIADYIMHEAVRTTEGGLKHSPRPHHETYWVDTMYYSVPGLALHGLRCGDGRYFAEGARQLRLHADRLRNPATGLFYHRWDEGRRCVSPELWGRGNGWIVMSAAEWLTHAPTDEPDRPYVAGLLERMAEALYRLQTPAGMWRTVLDRPETYEELSATAMFAFGLARGFRLKILDARARNAALQAGRALSAHVASDGAVTGVSAGTGPGDAAHYQAVPVGTYPWGTGAWLLAAAELTSLSETL